MYFLYYEIGRKRKKKHFYGYKISNISSSAYRTHTYIDTYYLLETPDYVSNFFKSGHI